MASRRPIYRKQERRSISKRGLMFCMLLAGGVLLVPIGGDIVHMGKAKLRDLALSSGVIDLNECVVTPNHAIACNSDAVGMPLQAALRMMEDNELQAAAEKKQREKAESAVRELALELARLNAQQNQLAGKTEHSLPPIAGEVTPTARTGAGQSGGVNTQNTATQPQSTTPGNATPATPAAGAEFSLTPPSEDD
jgi:hypothetical protein